MEKGQIDITVVGDFDREEIVKQVARTFGTLPKRQKAPKDYPNMQVLKFPEARKSPIILPHKGDKNRALLQTYWPAPDGRDITANRRFSVLRRILQNRLTDIIREQEAAAYSPSTGRSGSRWFPNYGYMSVSIGLKPEKLGDMQAKILEIADDFAKAKISEDEFARAIKPILENLDTSLESNSYWAGVIGNALQDNRGLENFRTREKAFQSMTLSDIKPLAQRIFAQKKPVIIHIKPE